MDERVLVIPTARFRAAGSFLGFRPANTEYRDTILAPEQFQFRPRSEVETDPEFKQLIPYIVLKCDDRLFHYRRGSAGTEARLRALWSVGIGGHISEEDAAGSGDPYRTGMLRELAEEVTIRCPWTERFLGFINDDRTPVGSVHLGVVHLLELETPDVSARESVLADAGFAPIVWLVRKQHDFESWSQFVLAELGRSE